MQVLQILTNFGTCRKDLDNDARWEESNYINLTSYFNTLILIRTLERSR